MNQNASGDIDRVPCPKCKELIAVDAVKCRYCGHEKGASLQRFLGLDLSGMSSTRRILNLVGFAVIVLAVLSAVLSR